MAHALRIAVFGASGFLGRYLVRRLADAGHTVHAYSRRPSQSKYLCTAGQVGQVVCDYADLARPETIEGQLSGHDVAINLVGVLCENGAQNFTAIHNKGAALIAKEAARAGVKRLIHVSSLGVDKAQGDYAKSKLAGEAGVLEAFPGATIIRPSILFGAEDDFFNRFAAMARFMPFLPAIGGGKTLLAPVYVDDVALAITLLLNHPEAQGQIYELAGPEELSMKDIYKRIGDYTRRPRCALSLPFPLASLAGHLAEILCWPTPFNPPLTADQVRMLKSNNVASGEYPGFAALGIKPQLIAGIVPDYLKRFARS